MEQRTIVSHNDDVNLKNFESSSLNSLILYGVGYIIEEGPFTMVISNFYETNEMHIFR